VLYVLEVLEAVKGARGSGSYALHARGRGPCMLQVRSACSMY